MDQIQAQLKRAEKAANTKAMVDVGLNLLDKVCQLYNTSREERNIDNLRARTSSNVNKNRKNINIVKDQLNSPGVIHFSDMPPEVSVSLEFVKDQPAQDVAPGNPMNVSRPEEVIQKDVPEATNTNIKEDEKKCPHSIKAM